MPGVSFVSLEVPNMPCYAGTKIAFIVIDPKARAGEYYQPGPCVLRLENERNQDKAGRRRRSADCCECCGAALANADEKICRDQRSYTY